MTSPNYRCVGPHGREGTEEECRTTASQHGETMQTINNGEWPRSCYVFNGKYFFNTNQTNTDMPGRGSTLGALRICVPRIGKAVTDKNAQCGTGNNGDVA